MLKTKINQKGFTIVELLIVIVVIGILAALVLNTFSGVQKRARDTQRKTDVTNIGTQLEAYYNQDNKGVYPQFSQFDSTAEASALFKGVDTGSFDAPGAGAFDLGSATSTGIDNYGYVAQEADGSACNSDDACTQFTLSWTQEEGGAQSKNSLNRN